MSDLGITVGWDDVDENDFGDFTPLPAGLYTVSATKAENKNTKSGGRMVKIEWTVQSGDFANRVIFDSANIVNANPVAQKIGQAQLKNMFKAMGFNHFGSTHDLLHKPIVIRVVVDPPRTDPNTQKTYGASNSVKKYMSFDEAQDEFLKERNQQASQPQQQQQQQQTPPQQQQQQQQQSNPQQQQQTGQASGPMPWEM